jgi:hypothetical protein
MAQKLIDAEQAARILGMTADQVSELRERRELFGKRDGNVWKFNQDDIEQYKRDMAEESGSGSDSGELTDAPAELGDDLDSILLSENELGDSPDSTTSTIIGKNKSPGSDIKLAGDESADEDVVASGSDVELKLDDSSASGLKLVAGGEAEDKVEEIEDLDLAIDEPSDSAMAVDDDDMKLSGDSGLDLAGDSGLKMAGDSDLSLGGDTKDKGAESSGLGGSSLDLAPADDEDMVLGGSDSDITSGGGDSGIGLTQPSDIGMSLDSGVGLAAGGSGKDDMLELGDEDVMGRGDDDAAELQADDEFLLTPASEGGMEESDSGSQVIALDTDADEFAVAGIGKSTSAALVEEAAVAPAPEPVETLAPASSMPDVRFSMANILALSACVLALALCGMMMFDLVRNMWSWSQPYPVTSSLMEGLMKWFG